MQSGGSPAACCYRSSGNWQLATGNRQPATGRKQATPTRRLVQRLASPADGARSVASDRHRTTPYLRIVRHRFGGDGLASWPKDQGVHGRGGGHPTGLCGGVGSTFPIFLATARIPPVAGRAPRGACHHRPSLHPSFFLRVRMATHAALMPNRPPALI